MLQKTHWTDTVLLKVAFPLILERIQPMQHHKIRKVKSYTVFPKVEGISGSGGNRTKTIYSLRVRVCVFKPRFYTWSAHVEKQRGTNHESWWSDAAKKLTAEKTAKHGWSGCTAPKKSKHSEKEEKIKNSLWCVPGLFKARPWWTSLWRENERQLPHLRSRLPAFRRTYSIHQHNKHWAHHSTLLLEITWGFTWTNTWF